MINTILFLNGVFQAFRIKKIIADFKSLTAAINAGTIAANSMKGAMATLKASLGIIGIIAGVVGFIRGAIEGARSAQEAAEEARKERIANIQEDLQATEDLRTEYNEFIATIEDEEELNDKIAEQYDKLAQKARAYGVAIKDTNGDLKDYLKLSGEVELQQLKQLEREMRGPAEQAEKYLKTSGVTKGKTTTRTGFEEWSFSGSPEERLKKMQAALDKVDELLESGVTDEAKLWEALLGKDLDFGGRIAAGMSVNKGAYKDIYNDILAAIGKLQEQIEEKVGLVEDYAAVSTETTFKEKFKDIWNVYEQSFAEWQEQSKRDQVTSAEAQIESLDQFVEQVVSKYPELEEYVNNLTKAMYGAYDEAKHYDIVLDMFDKKLADIRAQQKLDEEELKTQEKLLKVEQARAALADAQRKKIRVFRAGQGWTYEQDAEAVQEAQTALTEAERNAGIDELSRATANIETLIEYYNQAVKDDREELYNYFSEEKNLLEFEAMTFEQKLEALERFIKDTDWNAVKPRVDVTGYNASGTRSWRGGTTWVGENGPELVNLPQGTEILSNTRSMRLTRLADSPSSFAKSGSTANNMIFNGNLNFPNVRTADDANGFISALQALATPKMATFH